MIKESLKLSIEVQKQFKLVKKSSPGISDKEALAQAISLAKNNI